MRVIDLLIEHFGIIQILFSTGADPGGHDPPSGSVPIASISVKKIFT